MLSLIFCGDACICKLLWCNLNDMNRRKSNGSSSNNSRQARAHVRVIGGQWRGRKLPIVSADGLRPTGDRIKETLFNWLAPYLDSAVCLDLFAGSGSLGVEALSRGARHVTALDINRDAVKSLVAIGSLLETEALEVVQADALAWLGDGAQSTAAATTTDTIINVSTASGQRFDIVFLDPPFQSALLQQAVLKLDAANCLQPNALIYIETDSNHDVPILPAHWRLHKQKTAGSVQYALYIAEVT